MLYLLKDKVSSRFFREKEGADLTAGHFRKTTILSVACSDGTVDGQNARFPVPERTGILSRFEELSKLRKDYRTISMLRCPHEEMATLNDPVALSETILASGRSFSSQGKPA